MSKRLKNGIYTARLSGGNVRYFVHDGLIIMNSKYGNYKTTENFMLGSLNVSPNEFLEAYNKLENW